MTLKKRRAEIAAQFKEAVVQSVLSVKNKRVFAGRRFEKRPNYDQSTWGKMLANPRSQDPSDKKVDNSSDVVSEFHFQYI